MAEKKVDGVEELDRKGLINRGIERIGEEQRRGV